MKNSKSVLDYAEITMNFVFIVITVFCVLPFSAVGWCIDKIAPGKFEIK